MASDAEKFPTPQDSGAGGSMNDDDFDGRDPFLEQSLRSLPEIQVPSSFLPNVMFRVYERHARESIRIPTAIALTLLLLLGALLFFFLDVHDHMDRAGLETFSQALDHRIDTISADFDYLFSAIGGILSASWQILSGSAGLMGISGWVFALGAVAVFAVLVFLIRKGLRR